MGKKAFALDLTEKQKLRVVKNIFKDLQKQLKTSKHCKFATTATGMKLTLPKSGIAFIPIEYTIEALTKMQRELLVYLGRVGKISLAEIQEEYDVTRAAARREVGELVEEGHIEVIRDGRGQAFRLF